jgi:hypothetical protein
LLVVTVAGCTSGGSSDPGAINLPPPSATSLPMANVGGPVVTFTGDTPEVSGHYPATQALAKVAAGLPSGCQANLERSDQYLVSVEWTCGRAVSGSTVTLGGATVTLDGILTGNYRSYLSSVAAQQFQVEGQPAAGTPTLSAWYLTPEALAVVYPGGVVTYPLASLTTYLKDPSSL